jgi:hypothetical protein
MPNPDKPEDLKVQNKILQSRCHYLSRLPGQSLPENTNQIYYCHFVVYWRQLIMDVTKKKIKIFQDSNGNEPFTNFVTLWRGQINTNKGY